MSDKRRGLGRGLGALIPSSASANASGNGSAPSRPVDLFFPEAKKRTPDTAVEETAAVEALDAKTTASSAASDSVGSDPQAKATASKPAAKDAVAAGPTSEEAARPAVKKAPARKPAASKTDAPVAAHETTEPAAPAASDSEDNGVDLVEVPGVRFAEIPVSHIHPNRKQPRSVFDEDDMAELVHSVREIGVLQPIVVRTSTEEGGEPYELVMGERRWRAVQAAGLDTIPAIVRDTTDDDLLRDALLENLHRSQLNPLEEAAAYQQLLEDFGTTHEQLADRIGRSRPQVSNTLRLLKLPPLVQRRVGAGVISAGHARALLALPDAAAMERLAQKIVAEGMSVRATEEAVTLYQSPAAATKNNIPRPGARHERLDYLASSLSDRLDTNVKISLGARKGRVSIEFASVEDLNRIMDVLTPGNQG
ncbi:ParB/RepB/Spo0J family partition protein [Arthrobacter sp. UKPF54-2]|uniref:ParB/RepB/Spo0J family partition protein n=1 Tax=Arthrobacter sp. UKPF54-2 TaxID=2600159 RepID=UPI0011B1C061|nr:ParB/RepB/Spo0J family partition protein [Arthrobacter sp. UKPF54-2]QDY89713.1 ParB/RepB/Spo0J family partition protein [Arthrobacter sp. UKPF54-2]